MSDREHAHMMLNLALRNLRALRGMLDANTFANEIFGFHAQQAVEKALKAWLSLVGVDYPRIHDLEELLELLAQHGTTVPEHIYGLINLTDFAVQLRYAAFEYTEEQMDRPAVIHQVTELVDCVAQLLSAAGESEVYPIVKTEKSDN